MNLNDLPIECQSAILINLSLRQILACRRINKQFRHLIDNFLRLEHLRIDDDPPSFEREEFNDFRPTLYTVNVGKLSPNRFELRASLFRGIRRLFVTSEALFHNQSEALELLHFYSNLELLKLNQLPDQLPDHQIALQESTEFKQTNKTSVNRLSLKRLKILEIGWIEGGQLVFDLPSLIKLKIGNTGGAQISFVHPESVRCVHVCSNSTFIDQLTNLEHLFMDDLLDDLTPLPFEFAKSLKEFHFKSQHSDALLAELKAQIKQRKDLKIYFYGVDINCLASAHQTPIIELICLHHTCLADVVSVEFVDYSHLESFFSGNLPKHLVSKFRNVNQVNVKQTIRDEQQLSTFLLSIAYLTHLSLIGSRLRQPFYDALPQRSSFIQQLTIVDDLEIVNDLNLGFLFSFAFLQKFTTNKFLDCQLVESLFKKLRHLSVIKFKKGRIKIEVMLTDGDRLLVRNNQGKICSFDEYRTVSGA